MSFYLRHVLENHWTSFHEILYWSVVLEFNHFKKRGYRSYVIWIKSEEIVHFMYEMCLCDLYLFHNKEHYFWNLMEILYYYYY